MLHDRIFLFLARATSSAKIYLKCEFKISIKPTYKIQVTHVKFTTISKIINTNQMLIIPSLFMYYRSTNTYNDPGAYQEFYIGGHEGVGLATLRLCIIYVSF